MSEVWQTLSLGKILALEYGKAMQAERRTGEGFPVFGSSGQVGMHSHALVQGPGIVVGRKGTVGSVIWSSNDFWPIDTTYFVQTQLEVDLKWLYWMLGTVGMQGLDSSTGVPGLNRNDAYGLSISFPPLPEQQRIAEILDTLDEAIRKTEQVIAKLQQVKQGLLHDLLTRGIDEHGELRDPDRHPEQFKDSELGRIPREWEAARLADVAEVDRGRFTHRPRNDPRFFGGRHFFIQTGDVALARGDLLSTASQRINERGLSVSRSFPASTIAVTIAANIADTAILAVSMCFPDSVVGVVVHPGVNVRWVELCIRRAKRSLDARAPQSAQKNINLQDLRPLLVPLPSLAEQLRIAAVYLELEAEVADEGESLTKLRSVKSALMHDLLTGRVRTVPQ